MSDRIGVMSNGRVVQVGTPTEIYETPGHLFVTTFIGESNLLEGTVQASTAKSVELALGDGTRVPAPPRAGLAAGQRVKLVIRPENVFLDGSEAGQFRLPAVVDAKIYQGALIRYRLTVAGQRLVAEVQNQVGRAQPEAGSRVMCTGILRGRRSCQSSSRSSSKMSRFTLTRTASPSFADHRIASPREIRAAVVPPGFTTEAQKTVPSIDRADCEALDRADPLRQFRDRFHLSAGPSPFFKRARCGLRKYQHRDRCARLPPRCQRTSRRQLQSAWRKCHGHELPPYLALTPNSGGSRGSWRRAPNRPALHSTRMPQRSVARATPPSGARSRQTT
jgi:hypothetical protein